MKGVRPPDVWFSEFKAKERASKDKDGYNKQCAAAVCAVVEDQAPEDDDWDEDDDFWRELDNCGREGQATTGTQLAFMLMPADFDEEQGLVETDESEDDEPFKTRCASSRLGYNRLRLAIASTST